MSGCGVRSCSPRCTAGPCGRWRQAPSPIRFHGDGGGSPSAATSRYSGSTISGWSRGCRPSSSTTCWSRRGSPEDRLLVDLAVGPGERLQALVGDRVAADHRDAVGALLEPRFGALDRLERPLEVLAQALVGLILLEVLRLIAAVLGRVRRLGTTEAGQLPLDPRPLLGEPRACAFRVHVTDPTGHRPTGSCGGSAR